MRGGQGRCLFVVDEPRVAGPRRPPPGRPVRTARDAGLAWWSLTRASPAWPRSTWTCPTQSCARQVGRSFCVRVHQADAERMSALFGMAWRAETSTASDGRTVTRQRRNPASMRRLCRTCRPGPPGCAFRNRHQCARADHPSRTCPAHAALAIQTVSASARRTVCIFRRRLPDRHGGRCPGRSRPRTRGCSAACRAARAERVSAVAGQP